jgi:hypothetical protein
MTRLTAEQFKQILSTKDENTINNLIVKPLEEKLGKKCIEKSYKSICDDFLTSVKTGFSVAAGNKFDINNIKVEEQVFLIKVINKYIDLRKLKLKNQVSYKPVRSTKKQLTNNNKKLFVIKNEMNLFKKLYIKLCKIIKKINDKLLLSLKLIKEIGQNNDKEKIINTIINTKYIQPRSLLHKVFRKGYQLKKESQTKPSSPSISRKEHKELINTVQKTRNVSNYRGDPIYNKIKTRKVSEKTNDEEEPIYYTIPSPSKTKSKSKLHNTLSVNPNYFGKKQSVKQMVPFEQQKIVSTHIYQVPAKDRKKVILGITMDISEEIEKYENYKYEKTLGKLLKFNESFEDKDKLIYDTFIELVTYFYYTSIKTLVGSIILKNKHNPMSEYFYIISECLIKSLHQNTDDKSLQNVSNSIFNTFIDLYNDYKPILIIPKLLLKIPFFITIHANHEIFLLGSKNPIRINDSYLDFLLDIENKDKKTKMKELISRGYSDLLSVSHQLLLMLSLFIRSFNKNQTDFIEPSIIKNLKDLSSELDYLKGIYDDLLKDKNIPEQKNGIEIKNIGEKMQALYHIISIIKEDKYKEKAKELLHDIYDFNSKYRKEHKLRRRNQLPGYSLIKRTFLPRKKNSNSLPKTEKVNETKKNIYAVPPRRSQRKTPPPPPLPKRIGNMSSRMSTGTITTATTRSSSNQVFNNNHQISSEA